MASSQRYQGQAGYVLHGYRYQETSLIVEMFTREFGRVGMVAKGAKRATSTLRGALSPFHALTLDWSGRAELKTLRGAEWRGGFRMLTGRALICGFYLNELLLKLLHRDDPHDALYDVYEATLAELHTGGDHAAILRSFEKRLLRELGYALLLECDAAGVVIDPDRRYQYVIDQGPVAITPGRRESGGGGGDTGLELLGQTLIDMHEDHYTDATTLQQSKSLMRHLIGHYIGHQKLHSRQLLIELQGL